MKFPIVLLMLIFLINPGAQGSARASDPFNRFPPSIEVLNSEFSKFYDSDQISARHCGQNISRFIKHLSSIGFDPAEFVVLSMTSPGNPWGMGMLVAVNSRWGRPVGSQSFQTWDFHVIAVRQGYVYDFSYHQEPMVIPLMKYIETMFIPQQPIAIYGESFRVRGEGPYYTPEMAQRYLSELRFEIFTANHLGILTRKYQSLGLQDLLNLGLGY